MPSARARSGRLARLAQALYRRARRSGLGSAPAVLARPPVGVLGARPQPQGGRHGVAALGGARGAGEAAGAVAQRPSHRKGELRPHLLLGRAGGDGGLGDGVEVGDGVVGGAHRQGGGAALREKRETHQRPPLRRLALELRQGVGQRGAGLAVRVACGGGARGAPVVAHRAHGVAAGFEVVCQQRRDRRGGVAVCAFEPIAHAQVQARGARRRHARLEHRAVQGVGETVAGGGGAVGQRLDAVAAHPVCRARELFCARLDCHRVALERGGDERGREPRAGERGGLEQGGVVLHQALDLLLEQRPQPLGDACLELRRRRRERPAARVASQRAVVAQAVDGGNEEERVAVRAPVQRGGELGRRGAVEARGEIGLDVVDAEEVERQLLPASLRHQARAQGAQAVLGEDHLDRPVAADHQQARRLATLGKAGERVERRGIAPVQVLERQHQRRRCRERPRRLRELAQHALAAAAGRRRRAFRFGKQRR